MKANPNKVLVKISEEIRRLVFEKTIVDIHGQKFFLVTKIKEEEGFDEYFAQGVSVGEVVSVGSNVTNIQVGDTVMLDYIVDVNNSYNVLVEQDYKIVSVNAITKYMKEDLIAPPNRKKSRSTIVHRKGELDEGSLVIAIIRGDVIIPNSPYLLMEYKEENLDEFFEQSGAVVWSRSKSTPIVERKVLFVPENSEYKPGDILLIEEDAIFSRSFGDSKFDVAYEHEVIASEVIPKWNKWHIVTKSMDDYRPVVFNEKYPWWCTSENIHAANIHAFLPGGEDVKTYWPECEVIDVAAYEELHFSDRMPKPDWLKT